MLGETKKVRFIADFREMPTAVDPFGLARSRDASKVSTVAPTGTTRMADAHTTQRLPILLTSS